LDHDVRIYLLESGGELLGVAPFVLERTALNCQVADFVLARIPLRRLTLLGHSPSIPEEESAHECLFQEIIKDIRHFDALYLQYLKVDSYLWKFVRRSTLVRNHFMRFSRNGPMPHPLLRFQGSFEEYSRKFSSKSRWHQARWIKRLEQRGAVELVRVTEPDQIEAFMDAALRVSALSWQLNVLGWGIDSENSDYVKAHMYWAAQRRWLRSYLLTCGGTPCAFMTGYQYRGVYYNGVPASDVGWRDFSVGNVLQLLAIKDMFAVDRPEIYDFATYAQYKLYFANDSYPEEITTLFPRRPYPILAKTLYHASSAASIRGGRLLDRVNLKPTARRFLRRLGWRH